MARSSMLLTDMETADSLDSATQYAAALSNRAIATLSKHQEQNAWRTVFDIDMPTHRFEIAFNVQINPETATKLAYSIAELSALGPNWNSYGAVAIGRKTIESAFSFLLLMLSQETPAPSVVPLASGGIQFEWHRRNVDFELIYKSDTDCEFFFEDLETGIATEGSCFDVECRDFLKNAVSRLF